MMYSYRNIITLYHNLLEAMQLSTYKQCQPGTKLDSDANGGVSYNGLRKCEDMLAIIFVSTGQTIRNL